LQRVSLFFLVLLLPAVGLRAGDPPSTNGYDWGLVRAYFSGGVVLSEQNQSFSKQDLFLAFDLEKVWRYAPAGPLRRLMVGSFFDTRLTSIPVTATDTVESRRSAQVQMGFYLPVITTEWSTPEAGSGALFAAPVVKLGLETTGQPPAGANAENFFTFQGYGVRLGHYGGTGTSGVAPDLVSYLDCLVGRWGNIPGSRRWAFEGRLKIPRTPLMVGFDANVGRGASDLRFLFGTRFDMATLLDKLR